MYYPNPVVSTVILLLEIYKWIVFAAVIASWLLVLGIVNARNALVRQVLTLLDAVTEPVFRQVRRVVPPIAGWDLSPIFVFVAIALLEAAVAWIGGAPGYYL